MSPSLGSEVVDDRRAPAALHEGVAVDDALEDAVRVRAELVVAVGERDRRVHDGGTGLARCVDDALGVVEHAGLVHDPLDGAVQHAAFGGEVVLVLDEDDGGGGRIDGHGDSPRSVRQPES